MTIVDHADFPSLERWVGPPGTTAPRVRSRWGRQFVVFALVIATAFGTVMAAAPPAQADSGSAYRNDNHGFDKNERWMAEVPDSTPLSKLSLPGTHDSGAYALGGNRLVITQAMNIRRQLDAGIRFLDIRVGRLPEDEDEDEDVQLCRGPELWIFHGKACQGLLFKAHVLGVVAGFLADQPTETVLMKVKWEQGVGGGKEISEEVDDVAGIFAPMPSPTTALGKVRGKVVLVNQFHLEDTAVTGIHWNGDLFDTQNEWKMYHEDELGTKWGHVKRQFSSANARGGPEDAIFVNFLSAWAIRRPSFYASGHVTSATRSPHEATPWTRGVDKDGGETGTCKTDDRCLAEFPRDPCGVKESGGTFRKRCTVRYLGINEMAMKKIQTLRHRAGIVIADFPGPGLIRAIIDVNPVRTAPTAEAGGPYRSTENSPITFDASGSSDPNGDSLWYRWDFDGNGTYDTSWSRSPKVRHTYTDDFTGRPKVEVKDGTESDTDAATAVVTNVAPTITATAHDVRENGVTVLAGIIRDPSPDDTFTIAVDWGDGAPDVFGLPAGSRVYARSHRYLDDDPTATPADDYAIAVSIRDDDGGAGTARDSIVVTNVAPVVSLDSMADETGREVDADARLALVNTRVDLAASVLDVGTRDTHTGSVDWGDETVDDLDIEPRSTDPSHVYTAVGTYTITLSVADDDGGTHQRSRDVAVTDAIGVVDATVSALRPRADDPESPGSADLERAISRLEGNNRGRASNGARDHLQRGNLNTALAEIGRALQALSAATDEGARNLTFHESWLTLAAKSVAATATDDAERTATKRSDHDKVGAARADIKRGSLGMLGSDWREATGWFQDAARAVSSKTNATMSADG